MVQGQQQQMLILVQAQERRPPQWPALQVEAAPGLLGG
jgi:hypothetical protein